MNNLPLILIGVYSILATFPVERKCGSNMENLWLDVVLVVDNSEGMTNDGLAAISSKLASIFSPAQIGTNPSNSKTTRIGMVTYNSNATVDAHLNHNWSKNDGMLDFYPMMSKISEDSTSFVKYGLQAAQDLLLSESYGSDRSHYKKMIIVCASTYKGTGKDDPVPVAIGVKARGIKILTIAYDQGNNKNVEELARISSPGLSFKQDASIKQIQEALLEVNCFCPSTKWHQYRTPYQSYGTCIQPVNLPSTWTAANNSCHYLWNNSYLASEFTPEKSQFIIEIVKTTDKMDDAYHIGLLRIDGEWYWDQPCGRVSVGNYENWAYNFPSQSEDLSVGMAFKAIGDPLKWKNVEPLWQTSGYVCETAACDTDNYCDASFGDY
ncbi:hypothetical protein B9Z55_003525 [Caenorhabditis nigoni]|nr:hypothetical protein B9Z55_003525 [Caenorhabditis nigoni]